MGKIPRFAGVLPSILPMKLSVWCLAAAVVYTPLCSASAPQESAMSDISSTVMDDAKYDYDAIDRFLACGHLTHGRSVSSKKLMRLSAHYETNDTPGPFSASLVHGAEGYDRTACSLAMKAFILLTLAAFLFSAPLNALQLDGSS